MKTVKSYVKQVLAQLTGNQDAVIAERNYRMGKAALRGQISTLETQAIKQENVVSQKEEELIKATYPTTPINETENYVRNIQNAQANLDYAKENLENTKHSIEYYTNLLASFDEDVEVKEAA